MKSNRPIDKSEEVMKGLGKEPGRISVMIPVSKILNWVKRKKKGGQNNEKNNDSWLNRHLDI